MQYLTIIISYNAIGENFRNERWKANRGNFFILESPVTVTFDLSNLDSQKHLLAGIQSLIRFN